MGISIQVDTSKMSKAVRQIRSQISNWSPALNRWATYLQNDTKEAWGEMRFGRLASGPVMFRSVVMWKKVRPMYTRKDGTQVPPWGGVPKVRGKGRVKARVRPSGAPVSRSDIVGQDTGAMSRQFLTRRLIFNGNRSVIVYTTVKYSEYQNALRPFNELGRKDERQLGVEVDRQVAEVVRKHNV